MHTSNRRRWTRPVFGLLLLAATCSGCLRGDVFEFAAYDRATDTFKFLQLDVNIMGETAADLDHMADVWKQRNEIIAYPTLIRIFGLPAILRVDANHYKEIDLALAPTEKQPAVKATPIPLDTIKIQPGKFFLSRDNTLCYFHEVTVGGKVVDQVLVAQSKELCQALGEEIDKELKRRADGGKPLSWDQLRKEIAEEESNDKKDGAGEGKAAAAPTKDQKDEAEGWPGDAVSLRLLKKAAAAGEIAIHRHGSEFAISLPLSPEDCRQAKEVLDLDWKLNYGCAKTLSKQGGDADLFPELRTDILGGNTLVVKTDLKNHMSITGKRYSDAKPDPKLTTEYRDAIAALRSRGIPIDEKLTAKQVIDEFGGRR